MNEKPTLVTPHGILYNSDCLDILAQNQSESINCVFADPPFNLGKEYNNKVSDNLESDEYLSWSEQWMDECIRVLAPGGSIFIYILPRWGYHFASHLEESGLTFRHWIALSMKGTFPRGRRLYPAHYGILYFSKGEPRTFNKVRVPVPTCRHCGKDIKDYGGHRKALNPKGLNLTDFWEDTSPARHSKYKSRWHINELKPMIPERCITISTTEDDIILDPFGGGGSTYIVAESIHRFWIGCEIGSCEPILERFKREFPDMEYANEIPEKLQPIVESIPTTATAPQ